MLLTFFGSTLGKYVAIAIVIFTLLGGVVLYVKWTSDTIRDLTQQVTALNIQAQSLKAANDSMQQDITNIQKAQNETNDKLNGIRVVAAQTSQKIRSQTYNPSNLKAIQDQVNKDMQSAFKDLQDITQ